MSVYGHSDSNLWIGTRNGLNKFDPKTETFTRYSEKDGLPNKIIYGVLGDNSGNLWFSTNNGLSMLNPKTNKFTNFERKDGLQSSEHNSGSFHKGKNGKLYFGGINGFNEFNPDSVKINKYIPPVVITDFLLFNKSVNVGNNKTEKFQLKEHINYTQEITLNYTNYIFAFEFSALNYRQAEKNQYKYMLAGLDKEWIETDYLHRRATYTNLSPGEYTFIVKASNDAALWNEKGTEIKLIILPPFWKTWWFRSLIVIFIITCLVSFYLLRMKAIKKQNKELELQVKKRTIDLSNINTKLKENQAELEVKQEEIISQRDMLSFKNEKIELQNEQIKGSIRYAKTIQNAILPPIDELNKYFETFILFRPKDIVSGDFYWHSKTDKYHFIAVVDCTGHGVPGAFMSTIGSRLLNEIIAEHKIYSPNKILEEFNIRTQKALRQKQTSILDGMDVCLCRIESREKSKVIFSGAKRDLYYYSAGSKSMETLKAERKSIGGAVSSKNKAEFTNQELLLNKGDLLYMTTDGYIDQNNFDRKRFGLNELNELLKNNAEKPLRKQKKILEKVLDKWQEDVSQRDDITILGIKI